MEKPLEKNQPRLGQTCENCRFRFIDLNGSMQCHHSPPIGIFVQRAGKEGAAGFWPPTKSGNFCGQFERSEYHSKVAIEDAFSRLGLPTN